MAILARWNRVLGRVFQPLSWVNRYWRWVVLAATALGLLTVGDLWWGSHISPWIFSDLAHGWLVVVGTLCLLAILALYGVEKERDVSRANGVKFEDYFVQNSLWWTINNVLRVEVRLSLVNNSTVPTGVRARQVLIQHNYKWLPLEPSFIEHFGPIYEETLIPARQRASHVFSLAGRTAQRPSKGDSLKVILAIPGQPDEEALITLPRDPQVLSS